MSWRSLRESAGLAQKYLLALSDESVFPYKDKFMKTMDKIDNQVARGAEIVSRLNEFGHIPEYEQRQEDLNLILNQVLFLSKKLSQLNAVNFVADLNIEPVTRNSNPLTTRMLIYRTLEFLLHW